MYSNNNCVIDVNQRVWCWSANGPDARLQINDNRRFVQVSSDSDFGCARQDSGELTCWSSALSIPEIDSPLIDIAVAGGMICGLDNQGKLNCWSAIFQSDELLIDPIERKAVLLILI